MKIVSATTAMHTPLAIMGVRFGLEEEEEDVSLSSASSSSSLSIRPCVAC